MVYEPFEVWQERHRREVEAENTTLERRLAEQNMSRDIELAVIDAEIEMRKDELLRDASPEYRLGFFDALNLVGEHFKLVDQVE